MRRNFYWKVLLSCTLLAVLGVMLHPRSSPRNASATQVAAASTAVAEDVTDSSAGTAYPRGRWRLAPAMLSSVRLALSLILVRFDGAEVPDVGATRRVFLPKSTRTKEDARALATSIGRKLQRDPEAFAAKAREVSEDVETAPRGGRLGVVMASQLPYEFLDALQSLAEGQVSRPIDTPYGYWILRRLTVPPESWVAWRQITIAHDQSDLPVRRPERTHVHRTWNEAVKLAERIYTSLIASPERFEEVARRESDHYSATRGGYSGYWSTHQPEVRNVELDAVASLGVDEIAPPIDTPEGIRIIQRVAPEETRRYAVEYAFFGFDREAPPESPSSAAVAERGAARAAAMVAGRPENFARLGHRHPLEWTTGRGPLGLEEAIVRTPIGSVTRGYIASNQGYFVARRLEPMASSEPPVQFDLPRPARPDLEYIVRTMPGSVLSGVVRNIEAQAKRELALESNEPFAATLEELAAQLAESRPSDRPAVLSRSLEQLRTVLGDQAFRKVSELIDLHVEGALLASRK